MDIKTKIKLMEHSVRATFTAIEVTSEDDAERIAYEVITFTPEEFYARDNVNLEIDRDLELVMLVNGSMNGFNTKEMAALGLGATDTGDIFALMYMDGDTITDKHRQSMMNSILEISQNIYSIFTE